MAKNTICLWYDAQRRPDDQAQAQSGRGISDDRNHGIDAVQRIYSAG